MADGAGDATLASMADETEQLSDREQALRRLRARRDFHGHLAVYVVINAAVWAIWAATGAGYAWPAWMSGAWGVGLLLNAWDVYLRRPITEADVEREMRRVHPQH